ncbi:MAG: hypothetical protein EBY80_13730 [Actinobacteria bacterium]|nr:hypothetical protein [Actinomycetota bacterium]
MAFTFANHAGRAVLVDGDNYHDLEALSGGAIPSDPAAAIAKQDLLHDLQKKTAGRTPEGKVDPAKLGAPSPSPEKVFGIGLNYRTHAAESGMEVPDNPVVFAKFSSCITAPNATIELRSEIVDYEAEIVVIIGKSGKDIAKADKFCELFVKWDGCSEWLFPEQIHLCGPSSMASMHHMMTECHRIALEMMGRKEFG